MDDIKHEVTTEPDRDSDGLIVWRCACGVWGTDYTEDEASENIDLHLDEVEKRRRAGEES